MQTSKRAARAARQLYRLCLVGGALDEGRARLVVDHVIGSGRRGSLGVLSHFTRLVRLDCARHTAQVVSATPLPADIRDGVAAAVARMYGPRITTAFAEDAALIGGLRVQVGSDVYDGSVQARLAAIMERL